MSKAIFEEWSIFGDNVIWLRKHYGISKKRMAELMGIGVVVLTR